MALIDEPKNGQDAYKNKYCIGSDGGPLNIDMDWY